MIISLVTDELSGDPETAFEIGLEWGIRHFELRGMFDQRVPRLSPYAERRLKRAIDDFGIAITAVSPGLFKIPYPVGQPQRSNLHWMDNEFHHAWQEIRERLEDHRLNLLPQALDFANAVGARFLIGFSFSRGGLPGGMAPEPILETLAEAAGIAKADGIELLIENEEGHWADTGARAAALIEMVGPDLIGLNWDPANALIEGDTPFPDGFAAVRKHVRNVHFKDARRYGDGSWELLAQGDVDWSGQIAGLAAAGYDGAIAIEAHLSPSVASTRNALERLRKLIDDAPRS